MHFSLKIFLTFMGILFLFGAISSFVFIGLQQQQLREHMHKEGQILVSVLAGNLQMPLYFESQREIEKAMAVCLDLEEVDAVFVYGADGRLVKSRIKRLPASSRFDAGSLTATLAGLRNRHSANAIKQIHEEEDFFVFSAEISGSTSNGQDNAAELFFETALPAGERPRLGEVQLVLNRKIFDLGRQELIQQNIIFVVLFLLFSLFATFVLTRDAMQPLRKLVEKVGGKAGSAKGRDEISLLAESYQSLVDRLARDFETIRELKDGLEETVEARTHELRDALRTLQETQVKLIHSEKMAALGQLVAGVAHEINNTTNFVSGALPPLTKRLAELETLLSRPGQGEDFGERSEKALKNIRLLLENIREGARRTNKIVNDLKNFSRPGEEALQPVDINHCLEATLSLAYPEYKYRVKVERELQDNLPLVQGAQGQLNQVFMNILLNAVHAVADKGTVLIRTWREGEAVHILFKDDGPGIPSYVQRRIFDPFFTTKAVGKGTGLGLSISYGIVKKHRGDILVRSEPGEGAEFEVVLPISQEGAARKEEDPCG